MVEVYFYGSLRKNHYNYERFKDIFGEENFKYNSTKRIKGFKLHSLGAYPMVTVEGDSELVVDHFTISEEAYHSVRNMELGAGYEEMEVDGKKLYYFTDNRYNAPVVESGDWSEYKQLN